MARKPKSTRTDELIAQSSEPVLRQKFNEAADYVRNLERAVVLANDSLKVISGHPDSELAVKEGASILEMLRSVVTSLISSPSLIAQDANQLKTELWKSDSRRVPRMVSVLKEFSSVPKEALSRETPSRQLELQVSRANIFLEICGELLAIYCGLRDRYQVEMDFRRDRVDGTPRQRDQAQRDALIKRISKMNPGSGAAKLFKLLSNDQGMKDILSRNQVKLNGETIRNVIMPRHSVRNKEFSAARAEPRERARKVHRSA